jgi:hypothetical protein
MAKKAGKPAVTVRFANGAKMAKSKKRRAKHRKNPANPARRNPSRKHARRRRNPKGDFGDRALKLAGATAAAVVGGVVSYVAMTKLSSYGAAAEYGIPAALFLTGAAIAKSHPLVGGGLALGSVAPFVPAAASKVLAALPASTTPATPSTPAATANGISRAVRNMRAIDMGAVSMGAVSMGRMQRPMRAMY